MADFSQMTDEQLASIAGVQLPSAAAPVPAPAVAAAAAPSPAAPAAAPAALPPSAAIASDAILTQESNKNMKIGNSIDGAVGPGQILPATFNQYAKPGERIDNPADNVAVHQRIIDDYNTRYNGDPARIAVAYFSGPGNVAPAGSPTPWKADHKDGNGKTVSGYVSDVVNRIGNAIVPAANASEVPVQTAPVTAPAAPAEKPTTTTVGEGLSDAQLAQIAGVELAKPQAPVDPTSDYAQGKKYLSEMGDAISSGVHDLGALGDKAAWSPESMNASNEILKAAGQDMEDGKYLGASRKVLNAFNATVRDTAPGKALTGLTKIIGSPLAPVFNSGVKVLESAGVPQDLIEGAGNVGMVVGLGKAGKGRMAETGQILNEVAPPPPAAPAGGPAVPPVAPIIPPEAQAGQGKQQAAPEAPFPQSAPGGPAMPPINNPLAEVPQAPAAQPVPPIVTPFMRPKEPAPASLKMMDDGKPLVVSNKGFRGGEDIVISALRDEGITAERLNAAADQLAANGKDSPQSAVDILTQTPGEGRNLSALLSAAINRPGQGAKMGGTLALRGKQSAARIGNMLDTAISGEKYYDTQKGVADTKKASSPIYKQAFDEATPIDIDPVITNIDTQLVTAKGGIKTALTRAKTLLTDDAGKPETSLQVLHNVKLALDDAIDASGKDSSMGRLSKAKLVEVKNQLLQQMDESNPLYNTARTKYADAAAIQAALEQGRDFLKMDKEEIGDFMRNEDISNPEKTAFATGARRALQDMADRRREGTNPIMALNNEAVKGRVSQLFGDPAKVEAFYKAVEIEQHMHNINGILGGSPTAPRLEYSKAIDTKGTTAGKIAHAVIEPQGALANGVGHLVDKQFQKQMSEMSADKAATIVRILTTKDPEALRYLAKKMEK